MKTAQLPVRKEFIYYRESAIQSLIADTYMFGAIFGGFFANAFFFGGKWYIYGFFMFLSILIASARTKENYHRFTDKEELKDFVNKDL